MRSGRDHCAGQTAGVVQTFVSYEERFVEERPKRLLYSPERRSESNECAFQPVDGGRAGDDFAPTYGGEQPPDAVGELVEHRSSLAEFCE